MRRRVWHALRLIPTLILLSGLFWVWQANPFADAMVDRGSADLRAALDRAMARRVDQDWLDTRLSEALSQDDLDRAKLLIEIGADRTPPVIADPLLRADFQRRAEIAASAWSKTGACMTCAIDATACTSLVAITTCLIPFELTPAGDINALRREGWAAMSGGEVDELNAGLAVLGLGATALVVFTGPASVSAKVGATALRVGRRIGSITPQFGGTLSDLSRLDIKAGGMVRYAVGRGPLDEALDTARLGALDDVSDSLTTVARQTSPAEALVLLRHVDSADDAARLARVATAAGPDTRKYFTALGKSRVFRALVRLSDAAIAGALLIYAAALHLVTGMAQFVGARMLRGAIGLLRPV